MRVNIDIEITRIDRGDGMDSRSRDRRKRSGGRPDGGAAAACPTRGPRSQLDCIGRRTEYKLTGKSLFHIQTFANKCEARMSARYFVYQLNAQGPSQGRGTVILGAKSAGDAAKKCYALKIKGAGGFGTSERECRVVLSRRKARQYVCRRAGGRVHPNQPRCLPSRRLYG